MSDAASALREPWESLADQRRVSRFGMWAFIASEVLFFGAILMAFTYARTLPRPPSWRRRAKRTCGSAGPTPPS